MSLQAQLKQLGTADLRGTSAASLKNKASFLFSARQAADQDLDTIYAIAYNGIMELVNLDDRFAPFEKTLFSETMKSVDRVLQTAEENAKLDESISLFLRHLSPYFLLKPAGKAIEWLLRRFRVHEYNQDAIIACILPYHETKSFVKMVSLLKFDNDTMWECLKPVKTSELPLDRKNLVKAMIKYRSVMDFVCKTVTDTPAPFSTLHTFFAATLTQFVMAKRIDASMTTALLPYLLKALEAKHVPELQIAGYMILSQLASRAALNEKALRSLSDTLIRNHAKALYSYCLLTVVHLAQSQESFDGLSRKSTDKLLRIPRFCDAFRDIATKYAVDRFLITMMPSLCKTALHSPELVDLLNDLILQDLLTSEVIQALCHASLQGYLDLDAKDTETKSQYLRALRPIMVNISQRHTSELDAVLSSQKDIQSGPLYEFVSTAFAGTKHQIVEEASTTLFVGLNSPAVSTRLLSIKKLMALMDSGKGPFDETPEIVEQALLQCLTGFNDLLTYTIRDIPKQLLDHADPEKVIAALEALFDSPGSFRSSQAGYVMEFLIKHVNTRYPNLQKPTARMLALYIYYGDDKKVSKLVSKNDKQTAKCSPLVKQTAACLTSKDALTAFASALTSPEALDLWSSILERDSIMDRELALLVVTKAMALLPVDKRTAAASRIFAALSKVLDGSLGELVYAQQVPSKYRIVVSLAHSAVKEIATYLPRPSEPVDWVAGADKVEDYRQTVLGIYKRCIGGPRVGAFEPVVTALLENHLKSDALPFLLSVWCDTNCNSATRARTLQITSLFIKQYSPSDWQHLLPALLTALGDEEALVRQEAIQCAQLVAGAYQKFHMPSGPKMHDNGKVKGDSKKPEKAPIVSADVVYGAKLDIPNVRSNDMAHFVEYMVYRHRELAEDKAYVYILIESFMADCGQANKTRKTQVLDLLLNHVKSAPTNAIRLQILSLLKTTVEVRKLEILAPLLEKTLDDARTEFDSQLIVLIVRCFVPENASQLGRKGDRALPLFLRLLSDKTIEEKTEDHLSTRHLAMEQLTGGFFAGLGPAAQKPIFTSLVQIATNGNQEDVRAAKSVLTTVPIPAKLFEDAFAEYAKVLVQSSTSADIQTQPKRGKKARHESDASESGIDLFELVALLEVIESRTIEGDAVLVKPLFDVLSALVNSDLRDVPISLEYINQLLMSALTRYIHSAHESQTHIDESALRVDTVVQCIRTTGNPQTHNQALLLMATVASMYPESVLHNIMAVFTFMGANVLRQDDNYSFQVIQQTLEKVIPPLVSADRHQNESHHALALQVKPIIKVFVDALFHIPKHRRLPLFTVLVRTLGEDEFLYSIVSLLLEKYAAKFVRNEEGAETLGEFCLAISMQFSPVTQMKAVLALLGGVLALPNEKTDDMMDEATLYNVNEHSEKELRRYKLLVLNFAHQLLSSKGFLTKIMEHMNIDDAFDLVMQPYFMQGIEQLLKIHASFSAFRDQYAVSENAKPAVTKFWRGMLKHVYDVLDRINALLPLEAFIRVITELIKHDDVMIRRKAMELFNERVNGLEGDVSEAEEQDLTGMVKELAVLVEKESDDTESVINKQSALLCISSLARLSGESFPAPYIEAIPVIIGERCLMLANAEVKVSSLAALTVICQETGPRSVPHLPKFMPLVLEILSSTMQAEEPNVVLQLAAIGSLETTVDVLPHFMSPYLSNMLAALLHPSIYANAGQGQGALVHEKAGEVLEKMAHKIPPRVLLAPVFAFFENAIKNGKEAVLSLYSIVAGAVRAMTRDMMTSHHKALFKFFLLAFDIRRRHLFSEEDVDILEASIIDVFLAQVMKLNETLFKPLFLKVIDWATIELAEEADSKEVRQRTIFFYRLVDALLERLKSIFAPYYGYLIDDVIQRLERFQRGEEEPDLLWQYLFKSLTKSFAYDKDNLWSAAKYDTILNPVLEQMNVFKEEEAPDAYLARIKTYLVPCVGQMATTVASDTLWKPLNQKVLLKTRDDSPEVRLAALMCIEEFYVRLGEEWLLFLAESISYLAELMEDDDRRVEKMVQQVNSEIEVHLGEKLDKFFT